MSKAPNRHRERHSLDIGTRQMTRRIRGIDRVIQVLSTVTPQAGFMTRQENMQLVDALRAAIAGRVVSQACDDWPAARLAWHTHVPQEPAAIVYATCLDDVQNTVRVAAAFGCSVSAQPRGHGATAHTADDAVLLRFDGMDEIVVQEDSVRVGAGTTWRDLNAALDGTGVTSLPGSNGDTTVVGYTLSGGLSWFGRKYGLAAHHIRAVDAVNASGDVVHVTADSDPDLFWALRGGGGEFAVVVAMELDLLPAPRIYGGRRLWSIEHGTALLRAYGEITKTAPDELSLWAWLVSMPDIDGVPEPLRGRALVGFGMAYLGEREEAEQLLAPLYAVAQPESGAYSELTTAQIASIAAEPDDPMPGMGRTHLLTGLTDLTIDSLLDEITCGYSPLQVVQIRHLGGALTKATTTDGPVGIIEEPYMVLLGAAAVSPQLHGQIRQAFDRVTADLLFSISGRVPMTFAAGSSIDQIFMPTALARLREIKERVDPNNLFRGNYPLATRSYPYW
ncbi:FAD-binding oxidoreductase [Kribbella sp. NPDC051587]|uniref:FAD-binding oxidoreductase n=1 Tax=Kribbella sp. NPDC051587 TaxID=3364119 RepID=UPI0037B4C6A2